MSLITDIQKYSIHDGDGIRTTVFFKGCNLRCTWCHNPETQSYKKELLFDKDRCVGCGSCIPACPSQAITLEEGKAVTDRKKCTACGECVDYCNLNLREIAGKEYPVDQLVKELRKDEMFYEESGGGVTLSGGEVMMSDIDYLEELVKKLHHHGISVTIDTCGQAPYENYERILPYVDTFLYDIKLMDSEIHKQYMGIGNELILSNLEKLSRDGARLYIRIPTVKEVNGSNEAMKAIINYLLEKNIHVAKVNLLPYHNTGSGKYMKIGRNYEGTDLHAPDKDEMNHFVELFQEAGFHNIKIGG
ncbi:trans-4-hydroxy-L-proline dehydratase activase [Clostridium sp. C105KSO13]|uniref:trans-4-hydroxy-L-proline dehydratase activase n=1 Tax=Clostridium sp. C105KSO13 TaxID=1776045 RepID=UPI0007407211|nr:trans-4-hydroxy-L-proline dehydratase activase [Clostridium sp. C105KSO13]CUX40775.1 Benzylsuccinate synthase activating enzyme [Clostridium sp. C105KSO13]